MTKSPRQRLDQGLITEAEYRQLLDEKNERRRSRLGSKKRPVGANPRKKLSSRLMRRYGITLRDYETLLEVQGGVCAICQQPCKVHERLSVDHNHKTNEIRGLLCMDCNVLLARARDSKRILARAIAYLEGD